MVNRVYISAAARRKRGYAGLRRKMETSMQDVFIEYLVRRRRTPKTTLAKLGLVLAGAFVAFAVFNLSFLLGPFSFVGLLAAFGAVYGAYVLVTNMNIEYEYALTNGEMDVDKIIAQRKRKRLATVRCREVEDFGRYKASEHQNKTYEHKIMACDHPDSEDLWFFVFRHKEKGLTLLVFNANDRMIEGMKSYLPRPIFHRVFRVGA